jgi:hypothetical protein
MPHISASSSKNPSFTGFTRTSVTGSFKDKKILYETT